jgi:DNA-directed RNA polymerase subunit RPC12/RpoP
MSDQRPQYFENIKSEDHRDFIEMHNQCSLCGCTLELRFEKNNESAMIKEEAHCPECEMRTRRQFFSIQ